MLLITMKGIDFLTLSIFTSLWYKIILFKSNVINKLDQSNLIVLPKVCNVIE